MSEIINRVQQSGIISFNVEEHIEKITWEELDIKNQLFHSIAIREKDFREWIDQNNWQQYAGKGIAVFCSEDAIIPAWAYMLIASKLVGVAHYFGQGNLTEVKQRFVLEELKKLNLEIYHNARIVIKGCSEGEIPTFVYAELVRLFQPIARSVMFGEPCSTVPVYKKSARF